MRRRVRHLNSRGEKKTGHAELANMHACSNVHIENITTEEK